MARGKHSADSKFDFGRNKNDFDNDDRGNILETLNPDNYFNRKNKITNDDNENQDHEEITSSNNSSYLNDDNFNRTMSSMNSNFDYNNGKEDDDDYYDDYDDEETLNIKKVILVIVIVVLIIAAGIGIYKFLHKDSVEKEPEVEEVIEEPKQMVSFYEGFPVLGQVKIDTIGVEQYILDSTEKEALENGVGFLYGSSINNYGNFVIVGHNYDKVFKDITKLKNGDTIVLVDKNMEEIKYTVVESYESDPADMEPLVQDDSKVELTLITCTEGATTRYVVKAEEKM